MRHHEREPYRYLDDFAEQSNTVVKSVVATLFHSGQVLGGTLYDLVSLNRRDRKKSARMRSDQRVREEICEKLARDPEIDDRGIEVRVTKGEVVLDGFVGDRHTRDLAEGTPGNVRGVRTVRNRLRS